MDDSGVLVRQARRRRSATEKRLIVEQTLEPGASVARVARAHGLNANVVFHWRREHREGKLAETGLVPVVVTGDVASETVPSSASAGSIRLSRVEAHRKPDTKPDPPGISYAGRDYFPFRSCA